MSETSKVRGMAKRSYARLLGAACLFSLGAGACKVDTSGRVLSLRSAIVPNADCAFAPDAASISAGYYDPWVNNGGGAVVSFVVENSAGAAGDEQVSISPTGFVANTETRRHDVQIEGVEGCWFLTNGADAPTLKPRADGSAIDCASLPATQRRLSFNGFTADEGSTLKDQKYGAAIISLLDMADLKNLLGPSFDPMQIPVVGDTVAQDVSANASVAGQAQTSAVVHAYSYATAEPSDLATRASSWGEKYPTEREAEVLLQVRVVGRMLSGSQVHSNWLLFPITVCPGCMRDACGPLVQKVCGRGVCTDGTPCMADGTCAAGSPIYCTPIQVYSGTLPSFAQPKSCLPAQNYPGSLGYTCEKVGCPPT